MHIFKKMYLAYLAAGPASPMSRLLFAILDSTVISEHAFLAHLPIHWMFYDFCNGLLFCSRFPGSTPSKQIVFQVTGPHSSYAATILPAQVS